MQWRVINLDRSEERLARFKEHHSSEYIQRLPAIEGVKVDRARLAEHGVIDGEIVFTDGALGNALSHLVLWRDAITDETAITIFEDDAILARNFMAESTRLLSELPSSWDYVAWGWNFDAYMTFEALPGYGRCCAFFDQDTLRRRSKHFSGESLTSRLFPIHGSFGTVGYSISPQGARKLLDYCMPLRTMLVHHTGYPAPIPTLALDHLVSSAFSRLSAYVAVPPLVITDNDKTNSTVCTE